MDNFHRPPVAKIRPFCYNKVVNKGKESGNHGPRTADMDAKEIGRTISTHRKALGLTQQEAASATSVTLVFLSVLLTALGLYHRLARYAGAGTLVPITGFANAVASPAIDFRAEGIVTGTAVKMFTVAGPVIVFGTAASVVYGLVLYLLG